MDGAGAREEEEGRIEGGGTWIAGPRQDRSRHRHKPELWPVGGGVGGESYLVPDQGDDISSPQTSQMKFDTLWRVAAPWPEPPSAAGGQGIEPSALGGIAGRRFAACQVENRGRSGTSESGEVVSEIENSGIAAARDELVIFPTDNIGGVAEFVHQSHDLGAFPQVGVAEESVRVLGRNRRWQVADQHGPTGAARRLEVANDPNVTSKATCDAGKKRRQHSPDVSLAFVAERQLHDGEMGRCDCRSAVTRDWPHDPGKDVAPSPWKKCRRLAPWAWRFTGGHEGVADADLYSSTACVLRHLRPNIKSGLPLFEASFDCSWTGRCG